MSVPPFSSSYWVVDGLLLAGPHPGPYDEVTARERLAMFLAAGFELFVDLTHPDEVPSYEGLLRDEASARGRAVEYARAPIRDRGVPARDDLAAVLASINRATSEKRRTYVHCWGGIGRTGTVIGCWLAQNGHAGEAALERLKQLRVSCDGGIWRSPETEEQREMVRTWVDPAAGG